MSASAKTMLDEAVEALEFSRMGTLGEVANIPAEHWGYRPHPNAKSVEEIVRHMIEAATMLVGEAADPEGDFTRRSPDEHVRAHVDELPESLGVEGLTRALETTLDISRERVRAAGDEAMMRPITRFDGGSWRRLTYVFYAASHEDYHRGQLATYARSLGLVPALTQRIHGDDAR